MSFVDDYWAEVRADLRERRLQGERTEDSYPAFPWDVHGAVQDPPMPVSYSLAAVQGLKPVIDLPSLRARLHKLMGVT